MWGGSVPWRVGLAMVFMALSACPAHPRTHGAQRAGIAPPHIDSGADLRPDWADVSVHGLARTRVGEHWGFTDAHGAWVIPPTYDAAGSFGNDLAPVRVHDRWGYVRPDGSVAIPARYLDADTFSEGSAAVLDESGWSYIDPQGAVRVPGPFEGARPFHCGSARVKLARHFLLGHRAHGRYVDLDGEFPRWEEAGRAAYSAVGADPHGAPRDGLDDLALDVLYGAADSETAIESAHLTHPAARLLEPQGEDHVWASIDLHGEVLPPWDVPACGGSPTPPVAPVDISASLARLVHHGDHFAFFKDVTAAGAGAVPGLVQALTVQPLPIRLVLLESLVRLGRLSAPAVPLLTAVLGEANLDVRLFATWALGRIGPLAVGAVPALMTAHDSHPKVVEAALSMIAPGDAAVRDFVQQYEAARVARDPVQRLAGRRDPAAVRALAALLGSPRRMDALAALGKLGTDARSAARDVQTLVDTSSLQPTVGLTLETPARCETFGAATLTLWRIRGEPTELLPVLMDQITPTADGGSEYHCTPWALHTLRAMGRAAAPVAPALRRATCSDEGFNPTRQAVLHAIEAP